jgi:hypothetical protein
MSSDTTIINQLLTQWNKDVSAMTQVFENLGAARAYTEVAQGRNTVIYLLGHMVAVHDRLIEALDAGERTHTQLDEPFLKEADRKTGYPDYDRLLSDWKEVNIRVSGIFAQQSVSDWLGRHHYVSESDFAKEPHRNRLAILVSRLTHMSTHLGQLKLIR